MKTLTYFISNLVSSVVCVLIWHVALTPGNFGVNIVVLVIAAVIWSLLVLVQALAAALIAEEL